MNAWEKIGQDLGGPTMRNMLLRMGAACMVLGAGAVGVHLAGWEVSKTEVMLRQELKTVPTSLGDGRWTAKLSEDRTMSKEEEEVLETKKYLLRRYRDSEKQEKLQKLASQGYQAMTSPEYKAAKVGETLSLNVNYYGTGGSDTHVPDVCWTGSGMERDFADSGDLIIKDLKLADGTTVTVPLKLVAFKPTPQEMRANRDWAGRENEHLLFVAYTFNVNGEYFEARERLPQAFWSFRDYPFLYHTKIEVTVNQRCTQAEARAVLEPFFRAMLPEVVKCLPDVNEELAKAKDRKNKTKGP
jgi:hypothetical protein